MTSVRRRALLEAAAASSVALAGCAALTSQDSDKSNGTGERDGTGETDGSSADATFHETLQAAWFNGVPQLGTVETEGEGTRSDPYVVPADLFDDHHGPVAFGQGWFDTDGIETDPDFDYGDTAVYLQGEGVRTTTLRHAADEPTTPTVRFAGEQGGNFGGIQNMTVYGADEGDRSGDANVVETDGDVIDYTFENVIIRWGGGDALHLAASASGCRVQNAWLENVEGHALYVGGGNRLKVDNVHAIGSGFVIEGSESHYSNVTIFSAGGNDGIMTTSSGNQYSNLVLKTDLDAGFRATATFELSNATIRDAAKCAVYDGVGSSPISNVLARDWGADADWRPMLRVVGDSARATGLWGDRTSEDYSPTLLRVEADDCYVDGIGGTAGVPWEIAVVEGTETVLDDVVNVGYEGVDDRGTRTLINRWGTNDGDPTVEGEWQGHADYAGAMGATVWDTTTSPWTAYRAQPDGATWHPV